MDWQLYRDISEARVTTPRATFARNIILPVIVIAVILAVIIAIRIGA